MLLLLLLISQSASAIFMEGNLDPEMWQKDERLPTAIYPMEYALKVIPNVRAGNFSGSVDINVTCEQPTSAIVLHAHEELHIDASRIAIISNWNSRNVTIKEVERNSTTDQLIILLKEEMQTGDSYQLHIEFDGKMKRILSYYDMESDNHCGFFKGNFTNMGTVSLYAGTHMGVKCARRIFPCFDEPHYKATFQISVACPQNLTAHSVMPVEASEKADEENWTWNYFAPTYPISTFSVNIFISSLIQSEPINVTTKYGEIKIQYHHGPNSKYQPILTEPIEGMVEFLEEFLGTPFPVPKLDIMLLPRPTYTYEETSLGTAIHRFISTLYCHFHISLIIHILYLTCRIYTHNLRPGVFHAPQSLT
ncbi:hypothetical protein C0J52_16046 [Blattella germanica]|nr:hypothetical protein C0J52_16046 [Blattella germanica]